MKKWMSIALLALSGVMGHAEKQPNIILIMADDVSWECFGCYGAEEYETPNIDKLAAQGVQFNHCYSTPVCTPSRVMIMTGQYNFRNYTHFGYLNPKDKTFGHLMQAAGYKTAIAGKWQLNGLYHGAEGSDDNTRPFKAGFDEYCLWQLTRMKKGPDGGERFWSPSLEHNGIFLTREDNAGKYGPDIMSDFICDFIERNQDQPFFVYYPTVLVHGPFVPTPDTIGDAPRTQKANKGPKGKAAAKANFQAMVSYMDKLVGKIVRTVEKTGRLENTIILFTADNGTKKGMTSQWNGQSIRGGKGTMTDMGTHVPLITYWKGHTPEGKVLDDLVDFTDLYPTLAEAAGIERGEDDPFDGVSFLPQLKGDPGTPRDWVLCHYQPYWNQEAGQFARTAEYKLYRDGRFYKPSGDLYENADLSAALNGERKIDAHRKLQALLENAPPAPKGDSRKTKDEDRVVYPEWRKL